MIANAMLVPLSGQGPMSEMGVRRDKAVDVWDFGAA
jgi:hypothetical protein